MVDVDLPFPLDGTSNGFRPLPRNGRSSTHEPRRKTSDAMVATIEKGEPTLIGREPRTDRRKGRTIVRIIGNYFPGARVLPANGDREFMITHSRIDRGDNFPGVARSAPPKSRCLLVPQSYIAIRSSASPEPKFVQSCRLYEKLRYMSRLEYGQVELEVPDCVREQDEELECRYSWSSRPPTTKSHKPLLEAGRHDVFWIGQQQNVGGLEAVVDHVIPVEEDVLGAARAPRRRCIDKAMHRCWKRGCTRRRERGGVATYVGEEGPRLMALRPRQIDEAASTALTGRGGAVHVYEQAQRPVLSCLRYGLALPHTANAAQLPSKSQHIMWLGHGDFPFPSLPSPPATHLSRIARPPPGCPPSPSPRIALPPTAGPARYALRLRALTPGSPSRLGDAAINGCQFGGSHLAGRRCASGTPRF
ncbi:hypothetical protein HU200_066944 [Digitaria exilis]|uniref:Uncharacterized protein n=1 Tax=Digitaria exilis TaxID=1010633 RepID=A0A835DTK9_9POAL|nr:hypothetical protein HU200_066944 [Digitaria exilis]